MDKKKFFSSLTLKSEIFKLPNGQEIIFQELKAGERQKIYDDFKSDNVFLGQVRMVAMSCPDFDEDDIPQLSNLSATLINDMSDVVSRLSGMTDETQKKE